MYLGIDVGGTFTDSVLIENGFVRKSFKTQTIKKDLLLTIKESLNTILDNDINKNKIKRLVVSTTLMTNLITENKYERIGLLLFSGLGINEEEFHIPFEFESLKGNIDFQGRLVEDLDPGEVYKKADILIKEKGIKKIGIVSKFAPRNPILEKKALTILASKYPDISFVTGNTVNSSLNFNRRCMNLALFLACEDLFNDFIDSLEETIFSLDISAPTYLLKADGGVIPIEKAKEYSVDTILSGPAASCFGAKAFLEEKASAVVIDIGGTTTDLSLILNGKPLYSSKGAKIKNIFTHVRALSVNSLPIGGDTGVILSSDKVALSYKKDNIPACLGGTQATITDCLRVLNLVTIGDISKSIFALKKINNNYLEVANLALDIVLTDIERAINEMILSWKNEPEYKVWQLLNPTDILPEFLVLLGGPSLALVNLLSDKLKLKAINYKYSQTANAIGACLSLPTCEEQIRINTEKKELSTTWGLFESKVDLAKRISKEEVKKIAERKFKDYLQKNNINSSFDIYSQEVFNMVRGWDMVGQIHEITLGIQPNLIYKIQMNGEDIHE